MLFTALSFSSELKNKFIAASKDASQCVYVSMYFILVYYLFRCKDTQGIVDSGCLLVDGGHFELFSLDISPVF